MATSNAATNYLEHAILQFLFKNNAESFATPGNSIYVGLATAVSNAETGALTEATFGNYARQQVAASAWTVPAVSTDAQTAAPPSNSSIIRSRIKNFCGLPVIVIGSSSTMRT